MIETKLRPFFFLIRCWHFSQQRSCTLPRCISAKVFHRRKEIGWKKRRSKKRNNLSSLWSLAERQEIDLPAHADLSLCRKNILVSPSPFLYVDDQRKFFSMLFLKDTSINWYKFIFTEFISIIELTTI